MNPLSTTQRTLLEKLAAAPEDFVEVGDPRSPEAVSAAELARCGLAQLTSAGWMTSTMLGAKITAQGLRYLTGDHPPAPDAAAHKAGT